MKMYKITIYISIIFIPTMMDTVYSPYQFSDSELSNQTIPTHKSGQYRSGVTDDSLNVLVDGYKAGTSFMALMDSQFNSLSYKIHKPNSAYYFANAYRWAARSLSLLPSWIGNNFEGYMDTHKVWKKRYSYMDKPVPKWLQKVLFFVNKKEWKRERQDLLTHAKYCIPTFSKHFRYPGQESENLEKESTLEKLSEDSSTNLS